jgi:hypothetical protein
MADQEILYPECEKLRKVQKESNAIGEFVEWLESRGIFLASYYEESGLHASRVPLQKLLAEFFDIDMDVVECEKRVMLEKLRNNQKGEEK